MLFLVLIEEMLMELLEIMFIYNLGLLMLIELILVKFNIMIVLKELFLVIILLE